MIQWIKSRGDAVLAEEAEDLFRTEFGGEPVGLFAAPGRVNLIGEHVDYAAGASIPFALEHSTVVAAAPRQDGRIRAVSAAGMVRGECALADVAPGNPSGWFGYVAGTVWAAVPESTGMDLAIVSDVPLGSGLSSSAALECAVGLAALEFSDREVTDVALAQLVEAAIHAENDIVGASTGGLDQNVSIFGAAGEALFLDFFTGERRRVPFDLSKAGFALLIADTNAPHTLSDGQYASRRGLIDRVIAGIGPKALRAGSIDAACAWAKSAGEDPALVEKRVRHVVTETQRTLDAAEALEAHDLDSFRALMRDSHVSLRDDYEVTTPELDSAFEAAGCYGARMTGGGFGGAVIALVQREEVAQTAKNIAAAASHHGFPEPTFYLAFPGPGARKIR